MLTAATGTGRGGVGDGDNYEGSMKVLGPLIKGLEKFLSTQCLEHFIPMLCQLLWVPYVAFLPHFRNRGSNEHIQGR
jgi:hypothetical protein